MFGHWYNSSLRRYCVLMGDLFSHVQVMRPKESGRVDLIRVPIAFSSKERFMEKLDSELNVNKENGIAKIETILPRMCLSLVDIIYNPTYKTNGQNKTTATPKGGRHELVSQYNAVPIKMIFELGIYTRHQDDMFQVIEQIWPYFQPHFSTQMRELIGNDMAFDRNIRVVLQSISMDNQVETTKFERRRLETNMIFEVNGWLYPPVAEIKGEIRTVYIDLFANEKELGYKGVFESIDTQVDPADVKKEDWDGSYIQTESNNIPIPVDPEPSAPRRNKNV